MLDDLAFALRVLRRFKLYSFAAVATLALSIGATSAVFSVIDATLLRPLPYKDPGRLVALQSVRTDPTGADLAFALTQIELVTWRGSRLFESIDAIESRSFALTGDAEPEVVDGGAVTSGFFRTLGFEPMLGRMFSADEERQNAEVAVLSHALWATRFNADPSVLGRAVTLAGRPHTIIGVMPQDLRLIFRPSVVWVPLNPTINVATQGNRIMTAIGRLRTGATVEQARSELAALSAPLAVQFPLAHRDTRPLVQTLQESLFGNRAQALWFLAAAVVGLLLLACANVANLTLAHLSLRQGELATRTLLGSGIGRLVRLLMLQTGLLALGGAAIGLAVVAVALPRLVDLYNGGGLGVVTLGIDLRVLLVTLAVVGGTTIVCAALPAWKVHRTASRGDGLRMAAVRFSAGRWERGLRAALVSAQVGIAVALLCASGMLLKSLNSALAVAPGFAADHVLTMQMLLPPTVYPDARARAAVVTRMIERVQQVPGVVAVGTTQSTFLPGQSMMTLLYVEGVTTSEPDTSHIRHITPGYFETLRVPVIEGRAIDMRDQIGAPTVCMVSEAFARRFFTGGGTIGRRIRRASANAPWMTVVGVVGDVRDNGLTTDAGPLIYVPYLQNNTATARVSLVARTQGDPTASAASIRQAIWEIDRHQPITRVAALEDVLLEGASAERFRTLLAVIFAAVGLMLAIVGVYAVTAASVTAKTWEASLRLALGAAPAAVVFRMLREATVQIAGGVAAGVGTFYLLGQFIATLLFQTSPRDPVVIGAAAAGMMLFAMAVAAWQSGRLARVSPAMGLRGGS